MLRAAIAVSGVDVQIHGGPDVGVPQRLLDQLRVMGAGVTLGRVGVAQLVGPALDPDLFT